MFATEEQRNEVVGRLCSFLKWVIERNPTVRHVTTEELTGFFLKDLEQSSFLEPNLAWFSHINEWISFHLPIADQFELTMKPVIKLKQVQLTSISVPQSVSSDATPSQMNYLRSLAKKYNITLPEIVSKKQASVWIEAIRKERG